MEYELPYWLTELGLIAIMHPNPDAGIKKYIKNNKETYESDNHELMVQRLLTTSRPTQLVAQTLNNLEKL